MLSSLFPRSGRAPSRLKPGRFESLESRWMLSGTPPTVVGVAVGSTDWSTSFLDYLQSNSLGTGGYAIPVGSSSQLTVLPWNNLNQIIIQFSEDVVVDASDLSVSGANVTAHVISDFSYDSQSHTAVWTLAAPFAKDKIYLDLNANGLDPVRDLDGNALDGEWTDGSSTVSGNGTAGGDFGFRFNVLPGDASRNGQVASIDYTQVASKNGKSTNDAGYSPYLDINGSGLINSVDSVAVYGQIGSTLPTGNPAGLSNDAPTTAGFDPVTVDEDASNVVLSLFDAFADAETSDGQMTYQIISNSNSALFNSVSANGQQGELTLDFAENAHGQAEIVIRATDAGGLHVDTTLVVTVNSVNDAPVVSQFHAEPGSGDGWTFTGQVADIDDDPTGWTVYFGGVLEGRTTTVLSDGTFAVAFELDPEVWGAATCWVVDPHGAQSNVDGVFVGIT